MTAELKLKKFNKKNTTQNKMITHDTDLDSAELDGRRSSDSAWATVPKMVWLGGSSPWSIKEYQFFPIFFFFASLCSFIYLQAVYQLSGAVCKATWNGYPSYSLPTFISRFVIDFLSIRKVIIFSAIATGDRHPLRSRSIHQNAANCRFRYIAQSRGVRKTYCARSRNDVLRLTSRSNGMPSKKIMESLRTFVFVESVLRRGRMFQGSDEV